MENQDILEAEKIFSNDRFATEQTDIKITKITTLATCSKSSVKHNVKYLFFPQMLPRSEL